VGILLRDGRRYPSIRLDTLRFAEGTPYETVMTRRLPEPEAVLSPELCRVVRASMIDVVERGTAVRARGALRAADGTPLPIGGKTGTGDNRIHFRSATGAGSVAINRTSTFVFFAGDRFFGTVVAYVPGRQAEQYSFTSSLPASVLTLIGPELSRL
jgi:cell division protein FtsI/penicillin-binding protein 2